MNRQLLNQFIFIISVFVVFYISEVIRYQKDHNLYILIQKLLMVFH